MESKVGEIVSAIIVVLLCIICIAYTSMSDFDTEIRHGSAYSDNGNTFVSGEVVEVDDNIITIEIGHNLYAFYGNNFKVGEIISVEITKHDEIISAWK